MGGSSSSGREWTPERFSNLTREATIVLVGGIVLGLFAAAANVYYVVAVVAAAVLVSVVVWRFEATLAIYALIAFIPWGETPSLAVGGSGVGKGVYISEAMLGFLLVVWVVKYLFLGLPPDRIRSGFYLPLALYLCYCLVNVVHSYLFWDQHVSRGHQFLQANMIDLGLHFMSAGALVMMATSIGSRKWLNWITICVLIPGLYNLVNGLAGAVIKVQTPWWPLLSFLPMGLCLVVALDRGARTGHRVMCACVVALGVYIVLVRNLSWISGWMGLLATLGSILLILNRKVLVVAVVVGIIAAAVLWPYISQNVVAESQNSGDFDRFSLMAAAWRYATTFPLGVGLGNYRTYNTFYYGREWGTTTYTSAHGTYSQHLSEMGIPGLLLFLSILICGGRWVLAESRKAQGRLSRRYLMATFGQLVGIACSATIGDYIIPAYHNGGIATFSCSVYCWIIWGIAIAHVRISREESNGSVNIDSQLEHS